MKTLLIATATITALLSTSAAWAVQDYDRPYMYCPIGTKWYGYVVLGDIRHCGGPVRQVQAKKNGRK